MNYDKKAMKLAMQNSFLQLNKFISFYSFNL